MSPRRTSRAGREAWAHQQRRRRVTRFRAMELASVLALEGNCAVPGSGWDAAEKQHLMARSNVEAAAAAVTALALCTECPVVRRVDCGPSWTVTRAWLLAGHGFVAGSMTLPRRSTIPGRGLGLPDSAG